MGWAVAFMAYDHLLPFDDRRLDDPLLRQAVLDLLQANRAFAEAFARGSAIEAAVRRIDDARERVWTVQALRGEIG